jgi:hypothetical protein
LAREIAEAVKLSEELRMKSEEFGRDELRDAWRRESLKTNKNN